MRWMLLFALMSGLSRARLHTNHVIAVVAGEAITQRYLEIESVLDSPALYKNQQGLQPDSPAAQRLLQQLIIRSMVADENRVLKVYQIPKSELTERFEKFKKDLGPVKFSEFMAQYSLSDADVRMRLESWIILERTLSEQEDVETWLKRLRARHNVTFFKTS